MASPHTHSQSHPQQHPHSQPHLHPQSQPQHVPPSSMSSSTSPHPTHSRSSSTSSTPSSSLSSSSSIPSSLSSSSSSLSISSTSTSSTPSSSSPRLPSTQQLAAMRDDELSEKMVGLYTQMTAKLHQLKTLERTLSVQAGQLLKKLQYEEAEANTLSGIVRKIRHIRKKLLARIANPRWEVKHHYHMTCMEHSLGHRQPHVMDVGEMLPGHLRLYALARCTSLVKKSLIYSMTRAKNERNNASEQIKEGYRQLRETRNEIKELSKLIQLFKQRSTTLPSSMNIPQQLSRIEQHTMEQMKRARGIQHQQMTSVQQPLSIRMRYFKTLNLAPKQIEMAVAADMMKGAGSLRDQQAAMAETYNLEKQLTHLLTALDQSNKSSTQPAAELKLVQNARRRIGLENLPSPLKFEVDDKDKEKSSDKEKTSTGNDSDGKYDSDNELSAQLTSLQLELNENYISENGSPTFQPSSAPSSPSLSPLGHSHPSSAPSSPSVHPSSHAASFPTLSLSDAEREPTRTTASSSSSSSS